MRDLVISLVNVQVVSRAHPLPTLEAGDWLVLHDTGANTLALFSRHCSRPAPVSRISHYVPHITDATQCLDYVTSCIYVGELSRSRLLVVLTSAHVIYLHVIAYRLSWGID